MHNDISSKDREMVYLSPSPFNNAFEEILDLRCYNPTISPTAGIICEEKSSKLFLRDMQKSTPAAKIRAWRSRLRGARIIAVNDTLVDTIEELSKALLQLKDSGHKHCRILLAHSAIKDGLVETGIPQVNIEQLNNRHSLMSIEVMTQEQFDNWFANLPRCFYELVNDGEVLNLTTESHKLTRRTSSNKMIGTIGGNLNTSNLINTRSSLCLEIQSSPPRNWLYSTSFGRILSRRMMVGRRQDVRVMDPTKEGK
jgi:hypothetical protein